MQEEQTELTEQQIEEMFAEKYEKMFRTYHRGSTPGATRVAEEIGYLRATYDVGGDSPARLRGLALARLRCRQAGVETW